MSKGEEDVEFVEEHDAESAEKTADVAKLKKQLAACKEERQEYLDGWQRAKADFINTKRRLEEDGSKKYANGFIACIEQALPALDSFSMAIAQGDDVGLERIYKQFLEGLELTELDPKGEQFDPQQHESITMVEVTEEAQDNEIIEVLQKGYQYKDTLIRPAKVQVGTFTGNQ